jgi:hypothetical protein
MKKKKNKKKNKKINYQNSNQLSFEFATLEKSIDVHIPKTAVENFAQYYSISKRLDIKLAVN